jgi:DNA-binding MarR family transcriptional regulator
MTQNHPDVFENSTLSMLIAAARRNVKHAIGSLSEPYGLNPYQYWMLWILREGPHSLSELATKMWMDHPTTSRLVHALEEDGYISISPDPNHGRRISIKIKPEKADAVAEICASANAYRTKFEEGLSAEELQVLRTALSRVITNVEGFLKATPSKDPKAKRKA